MGRFVFVLILLGFIILIFIFQYLNSRKSDKMYLLKLKEDYGKHDKSSYDYKRLNTAQGYFSRHVQDTSIDDITWSDLNMDDVFVAMDSTQSNIGSEVLYYLLRNPLINKKDISDRTSLVDFWMNNSELRDSISLCLHHNGRICKSSLYDNIDKLCSLPVMSNRKYFIHIFLLMLCVLSLFISQGIGIILFIVVLIWNFSIYYRDRSDILPYIDVFNRILTLINVSDDIDNILSKSKENPVGDNINKCVVDLSALRKKTFGWNQAGGEGNPIFAIINVIGALFFFDLIRFVSLKKTVEENVNNIDALFFEIGYIDAMIAISSYVYGHEGRICKASFEDGEIKADNIYHPLIANPISNSINTDKSILITGANASGKSTFLKSIAIGILFAHSTGYVLADKFNTPLCLIYGAMSNRDNIISGDSYYMTEIKGIKRILDATKLAQAKDLKVVCFVDELLSGTNTEERIAAATQILKKMNDSGMYVFAATHDIELTTLLNPYYTNYHFKEDLSEGDVVFSYKLMNGEATSRNAIRLLASLDFPEDIISEAEAMVDRHMNTGSWSLQKG